MTSFQSELGEGGGDGIAEELAQEQRAISIAEFFEKNKHMLGFDSGARGLVTAVKEAVDNSLTWSTPFVYRRDDETRHGSIGSVVDELIESNPEAVESKRDGDLEKLRVDDFEALSFGAGYDVEFRRVSSVFRHRVNSDIYRVTVEGGREVELTDYHSVFVLRDGEVVSVETSDLTTADYVVLPDSTWGGRSIHTINLVEELLALDESLTEPVGLYGVDHLLDAYGEEIVAAADRQQPLSDFRKCDRIPLAVVDELDIDREEYADCSLGVRYGRHRIPAVLPVTDGLAELLGLYIAEGCVTGSDGAYEKAYLSLGSHEESLVEYTTELVESTFGIEPSVADAHDSATNVGITSKIVALVLAEVFEAGTSASEKRIPRFVFDFPEYKRKRFVLGYAAGDGYPTASVIPVLREHGGIGRVGVNKLTLSTTSEQLASGLRYLLSSVGYDATYEHRDGEVREIDGRSTEFSDSHVLYVRPDQASTSKRYLPADELLAEVGDPKLSYNLDGRQTRVEAERAVTLADGGSVTFEGAGREIAESDLTALPITDIERIDYDREWVYDISVPGDQNFMAGTSPLACHNSLDAAEEAGIKPDVYVEIDEAGDYYRLVVEDNGPGVTREQVPKIFGKLLYGSRFHKREQNRGQQGIGISAAVLYSQLTSGKPARVITRTKGSDEARYFELTIDTDSNEPEIADEGTTVWDRPHGTRIELEMEANMRARGSLHDYIQQTAVVNPHARLELREPAAEMKFERADGAELPAETEEIRPHPHGVELGTLIKMLAATDSYSITGFMQEEFSRVGKKTADKVVDAFRDRHFGREMAWRVPGTTDEADVVGAIVDATANKGAAATDAFAEGVAAELGEHEYVAYGDVERAVDEAADAVEAEHDVRLGSTVRENAVAAAWEQVTTVRGSDCYRLVDEATTTRKDDAAIDGLARRIADRFADAEMDEPGVGDGTRDRVTRDTLSGWVAWAAQRTAERDDETFGETAQENVVEAFWERARTVETEPPNVTSLVDDRDAVARLLEAMRETDILSPPTDCLAPITEDLVEAGLRKEYDADFFAACTRDAEVHGGDPFIVEAGIAYGGDLDTEGSVDILRFANRVPLVYQRGACATVDVIKRINWRNYNLDQPGGSGIPNGPAVLMVHVASTNVPFTSESKDAVANVPEIEDEIELALREAARELKTYLNKQQSLRERRQKRDTLAEILPEMAEKLTEVTGREPLDIDDSLARIMNNVLVERRRENGTVSLVVENNDSTTVEPEITDICSVDPGDVEGASVVEMDGEWFVRWQPSVGGGETAELVYEVGDDAEFDVAVEGIEEEKLTTNA